MGKKFTEKRQGFCSVQTLIPIPKCCTIHTNIFKWDPLMTASAAPVATQGACSACRHRAGIKKRTPDVCCAAAFSPTPLLRGKIRAPHPPPALSQPQAMQQAAVNLPPMLPSDTMELLMQVLPLPATAAFAPLPTQPLLQPRTQTQAGR